MAAEGETKLGWNRWMNEVDGWGKLHSPPPGWSLARVVDAEREAKHKERREKRGTE